MAKVKRKRDMSLVANVGQDATELPTLAESIQAREMMKESIPKAMSSVGTVGNIPSAMTGPVGGPIGTIESTAKPVERPAAKAKVVKKASASAAVPAALKEKAMPSEPLSPQSWVNQGNQPSAYKDYLASWNAQNASKKVKVKKKG